MSLYAYCEKTKDGFQKSHCPLKCVKCVLHITKVKTIWKERFKN